MDGCFYIDYLYCIELLIEQFSYHLVQDIGNGKKNTVQVTMGFVEFLKKGESVFEKRTMNRRILLTELDTERCEHDISQ